MQLRKFYGNTVSSALALVKRELGPDALILETNPLRPDDPAARLHPEARYEVLAARDPREATRKPAVLGAAARGGERTNEARSAERPSAERNQTQNLSMPGSGSRMHPGLLTEAAAKPHSSLGVAGRIMAGEVTPLPNPFTGTYAQPRAAAPRPSTPQPSLPQPVPPQPVIPAPMAPPTAPPRRAAGFTVQSPARAKGDLLEDLGLLRSQINQLLDGDLSGQSVDPGRVDLGDYHALIDQGVDHELLAPHFRRWLEWRTTDPRHRQYVAQIQGGPALQMHGESLREWLWLVWTERMGMPQAATAAAAARPAGKGPKVVSLLGPTGSGKTTTLAKMASISRRDHRQNVAILTLDTFRFGATEQWRRMGRLMGLEVEEIVSQADISKSMERWAHYDWIGIDTPGGVTPESAPGILYGSILAQYPAMESVIVLPATQQESVSRDQMKRYRAFGAGKVLFSKLDESSHNGGIVNLTMDGQWKIDSFATGCRIPEDWESASRDSLWRRVIAPPQAYLGGAS